MSQLSHPYPSRKTRVIHVSGSPYEQGRQHAELLGAEVRQGMATFYHRFFQRMLQPEGIGALEKWGVRGASFLLDRIVVQKLIRQIPEDARLQIKGMADGGGLNEKELLVASVLPDLFPLLQGYLLRLKPNLSVAVNSPRFGCSSFVSSGKAFLHGRNLDFPGVAYWDRYPVIQCSRDDSTIPTIAITSAGVPMGGITGVNAERISVSLHQHYSTSGRLKGELPFVVAERVLKNARNFSSAIEMIRSASLAGAWAFVVTDGKTREAAIIESHPTARGIRKLSENRGILAHSNYFLTPECQKGEYATTDRMNWDNSCRKNRLEENVRARMPELDAPTAAKFLSEHYDPYWEMEKTVNRTVSQVYNIQSLVLDAENMKLLMAEGDAPIHLRRYQAFDLTQILDGKEGRELNSYPGYEFKEERIRLAKENYIFSFVAAFDFDFSLALTRLEKSLEYAFFPEAALVAALVNLKVGGDLSKSKELLGKARTWIEREMQSRGKLVFPPEYFEILLFEARVEDLMGRRSQALRIYEALSNRSDLVDRNIRSLAKKAGPYSHKKLKRMVMPYSTYIPFE